MFKNTRKEDLVNLLNELSIPVNAETETIVQLKLKIESSDYFKNDPVMITDLLCSIVEERKSKAQLEIQKMELQAQELQIQQLKLSQLEKTLEIEKERNLNSKTEDLTRSETVNSNNLEHLIKSVRILTIPIPEKCENLNLFFQSLERAFALKNVPESFKSEILINLLAEKLNNILTYVSDEDLKSYDKMKNFILKEYQPTAMECLHKFRKAQKENKETYVQFASRLNALFRYYLKLRDVNDFETLCDLIIHDKLFQSLDRETASFVSIKQGETWFKFSKLATECDIFFVNKTKPNDMQSFAARDKNFENRNAVRFSRDNFQYRKPPYKENKSKQISCYVCSQNHFARDCPNRNFKTENEKEIKRFENVSANSIFYSVKPNVSPDLFINELEYFDIVVDNIPCKALKDSGSELCIVNKHIIPHSKQIISQTYITSCFNEKKKVDIAQFKISLPGRDAITVAGAISENLSCEVILPSNIFVSLHQQKEINKQAEMASSANLSASENYFPNVNKNSSFSLFNDNGCENGINYLSNLCNVIDEYDFDLSHLFDPVLKNKLNVLVKNYKPVKTESTNLKMSNILSDDIPVCQRSRRLSFAEKQEVEKQMQHVDALSRHPVMMVTTDELTHKIVTAQENDEYIKTIKNLLQQGQADDYVLKNNVLYKIVNDQEVLVVPEMMQLEIVKKSHSLGHFSVAKTEEIVKRDYYFPNMKKCIENVVKNCVECILVNKKRGKGEGFLNPIPKENIPLSTYHIDFIGPLPTTNKNYNHIFTVIDAFTKFSWLYPVKNTSSDVAIQKLKQQQAIFGNPARIISDKGPAFTSKEFKEYCEFENIKHIPITTGVPRGNGQIERLHATIIPVLSKLSIDEPNKWYKYVDTVQRTVNSTTSRSTKRTPFELLTGVEMRKREEKKVLELLEEERTNSMVDHLKTIREEARKNILKIQEENRKCYNRKRKKAHAYKKDELVAIQRTQFGTGLKLRPKFYGPYKVVRVKPHDRYDVEKVGDHEGPNKTSTSADHMKLWTSI